MEKISLYIHIPFCLKKCHYCDFYSIVASDDIIDSYIEGLITEIALRANNSERDKIQVSSIYLGGGTPSLLNARQINQILAAIRKDYHVIPEAEITIEINPETMKQSIYRQYLNEGINRFSIGIQSFNDDDLKALGRIHNSKTALKTVSDAHKAGCKNISLDLIFGIPNQSLLNWQKNIKIALGQNIAHLSLYGLTIESGTPLETMIVQNLIGKADEEVERNMYLYNMDYLESRGFHHYEISNYALPGYLCRHNMSYWDGTSYIGLGASAHSLWGGERMWNICNVAEYTKLLLQQTLAIEGKEVLTKEKILLEYIMLGFRRTNGIALNDFKDKFDEDFLMKYRSQIEELMSYDSPLIAIENGRIRLTKEGLTLYNEVCAYFL